LNTFLTRNVNVLRQHNKACKLVEVGEVESPFGISALIREIGGSVGAKETAREIRPFSSSVMTTAVAAEYVCEGRVYTLE
jgi:hypothetical protein